MKISHRNFTRISNRKKNENFNVKNNEKSIPKKMIIKVNCFSIKFSIKFIIN